MRHQGRTTHRRAVIHLLAAGVIGLVVIGIQLATAGVTPWLVPTVALVGFGAYARYRAALSQARVVEALGSGPPAPSGAALGWVLGAAGSVIAALAITFWLMS